MFEDLGRVRVLVLSTVLALAFGAAACGSGDDDGGGGSDATAQNGGDTESAAGDPKKQVEADYDKFVEHIYEGRWEKACAGYSAAYVKVYPKQIKVADTCVKTMQLEFKTASAQPRPWVNKVELKGPKTAIGFTKIRNDPSSGNPIRFVEEDGTWKLDGPAPRARKTPLPSG